MCPRVAHSGRLAVDPLFSRTDDGTDETDGTDGTDETDGTGSVEA